MIGQIGGFQCAQNISGFRCVSGGSVSDHQILAGLYGSLVGYDAVFWYTYTLQTGSDSAQTADYHRVLQGGDDPGCQRATNQHRAYRRHPKECGAEP
jgi:hypothetical protein